MPGGASLQTKFLFETDTLDLSTVKRNLVTASTSLA